MRPNAGFIVNIATNSFLSEAEVKQILFTPEKQRGLS